MGGAFNDFCEAAIRWVVLGIGVALGRRNWLFSKSIKGAEASATVYSITETAILNGLKPYNYLTYILEKMKDLAPFPTKEDILPLLPWSETIPFLIWFIHEAKKYRSTH